MNEIKEMMPAQYSVQLISQLRAKKKQELKESKERILSLTQELFTPQQSKNKAENLMQHINAGIAAAKQIVGFLKDGCEKFRVNKK